MKRRLCGFFIALIFSSNAQEYTITRISVNTDAREYAPVVMDEGLVFCSDRRSSVTAEYSDKDGNRTANLYHCKNGTTELLSPIITTILHEGPATFSAGEDTIIFTRNLFTKRAERKSVETNRFGLFMSTRNQDGWTDPRALSINLKNANVAHPCLVGSGKLFFASDMAGGYGETDLYVSYYQNGGWSDPVNLGPGINSSDNEYYPFTIDGNRMYFASDREGGMGGVDLYYSDMDALGNWTEPIQLDTPINSEYNDYAFRMDKNNTFGHFTTDRLGSDDIFKFEFKFPMFEDCKEVHKPKLCYTMRETNPVESDTLPLVFRWDFGDGSDGTGNIVQHCYADSGSYNIRLSLYDTITQIEYLEVASYQLMIQKFNRPFIQSSDTVYRNTTVSYSSEGTELAGYKVLDYFWEFENGIQRRGEEISYIHQQTGWQNVQLGVSAKNVNTGDVEKLCAVKEVFVQEKVVGKQSGLEESEFVLMEGIVDTLSQLNLTDTEVLYALQLLLTDSIITADDPRFKLFDHEVVPRRIDSTRQYSYEVGHSDNLKDVYKIFKEYVDSGFKDVIVTQYNIRTLLSDSVAMSAMSSKLFSEKVLKKLGKDDVKVAEKLYYEVAKADLRPVHIRQLDGLLGSIKWKRHLFIVEGYTDGTGSYKLNQKLALMRAENVKNYLIKAGVSENQIQVLADNERFLEEKSDRGKNLESEEDRKVVITVIKRK